MKKKHCVIVFAFLIGCIYANYLKVDVDDIKKIFSENNVMYTPLILENAMYGFAHTLLFRGRFAFSTFLICKLWKHRGADILLAAWYALLFGSLFTFAMIYGGVKTCMLILFKLMPHWLIYGLAIYLCVRWQEEKMYDGMIRSVWCGMLILLIFFFGVVAECYINPWILFFVKKYV